MIMERKIGEIFEYNGEWYQCVKGNTCDECSFSKSSWNCLFDGTPYCSDRSDGIEVIFKKLEKVGEPYEYFVQHKGIVMLQPYKLFTTPIINGVVCNVNYDTNTIDLEIKQTKEDMEEKKQKLDDLVGLYTSAKITYKEFDEKLKTLYVDKEECKSSLKEFDLEAAKAGKPVCTRDGRKTRILCYDFKQNEEYPILVAVENKDGKECALLYSNDGISEMYKSSNNELAMLPEKKEGWVNLYKKRIYRTKEEAIEARYGVTYVDTVKISWEE